MKIRPVGAELFHADGQTERKTDRQKNGQTDRQTDRHDNCVATLIASNSIVSRRAVTPPVNVHLPVTFHVITRLTVVCFTAHV
jgi:hypothetical protein